MNRTVFSRESLRLRIFISAVLLVMAAIFLFSQQGGENSQELSKIVLDTIDDIGTGVLTPSITIRQADEETYSFILQGRKWGHVYLYALLGVFVSLAAREYVRLRGILAGRRLRLPAIAAVSAAVCFVYACSDEFHQLFIDGRTGSFRDVLFDSIGFCSGIVLSLAAAELVGRLINRLSKKRQV